MCCFDISAAGDGWNASNANWEKKCCMPSNGHGVIPPPNDVSDAKIPAISKQIENVRDINVRKPYGLYDVWWLDQHRMNS